MKLSDNWEKEGTLKSDSSRVRTKQITYKNTNESSSIDSIIVVLQAPPHPAYSSSIIVTVKTKEHELFDQLLDALKQANLVQGISETYLNILRNRHELPPISASINNLLNIANCLTLLGKYVDIESIKKDLKETLNLKPSFEEKNQQLIETYNQQGLSAAIEKGQQALKDGYPDALYALAKYCMDKLAYDDAYSLLAENPQDQREHLNKARAEFAHFIFTASKENLEMALRLLLMVKTDISVHNMSVNALKVQVLNEYASIFGTPFAIATMSSYDDTIVSLCEVVRKLYLENQALAEKVKGQEIVSTTKTQHAFFTTKNTQANEQEESLDPSTQSLSRERPSI